MAARRILLQFPVSHFCEKTRWTLEAKRLGYEISNLLPGPHALINLALTGRRTVPVLRDGKTAIVDSTAIALYLEQRYPERALLPSDPAQRAQALELDGYFSKVFGREVRRLCYGYALRYPRETRQLFFRSYTGTTRTLAPRLMGALFERQLRVMYRINDAGMEESERGIEQGCQKLAEQLDRNGTGYLVGNQLSLADISAASLLAPLVGPAGSPWDDIPETLAALHERRRLARDTVAGRWLLGIYANERQPSA